MATTSDCVEVAIHLQEGDTKTIKALRFDGDQLPGYTRERVEQEILELFPHIEKKGLRLRMHYYDDLAGKVYIDSNADIQNTLESFTEEWSSQNPRKNFLVLHVEDCINPDKVASQSRKRPVAETDCEKLNLQKR